MSIPSSSPQINNAYNTWLQFYIKKHTFQTEFVEVLSFWCWNVFKQSKSTRCSRYIVYCILDGGHWNLLMLIELAKGWFDLVLGDTFVCSSEISVYNSLTHGSMSRRSRLHSSFVMFSWFMFRFTHILCHCCFIYTMPLQFVPAASTHNKKRKRDAI